MTGSPWGRVSLIVRCFNEERHIGNLLDQVFRQSIPDPDVIVVDSGSTDQTLPIAGRFPVKIVRLRPEDFTFGRSLNLGCAVATGDYLAIASAHVIPRSRDWLEKLRAPFADTRVALVYGRQVGNHRTKFSEHQLFAKQFPRQSNSDQRTPFCNNANAAVRRSLWAVNRYDESLSGLEDLAWAKWACAQGHRIVYAADAPVIHIHEESPARIQNRYRREAIAFKQIFPDSHLTLTEFVSLLTSNVAMDLLAATRKRVVLRRLPEILMFRAMQYWGTYRGMNHRSPLTQQLIMQFYYPRRSRLTSNKPPDLAETHDSARR